MLEKLMPKGWTQLVDEAIERTIREEIQRQLTVLFPEIKDRNGTSEVGFSYSMREYITKRWTEILKADEEIDDIIREGLRSALIKGLGEKSNG